MMKVKKFLYLLRYARKNNFPGKLFYNTCVDKCNTILVRISAFGVVNFPCSKLIRNYILFTYCLFRFNQGNNIITLKSQSMQIKLIIYFSNSIKYEFVCFSDCMSKKQHVLLNSFGNQIENLLYLPNIMLTS